MRKNKVEAIAWSVEDAKRIVEAGADRIELIVNLNEGGLTPPYELVKQVCEVSGNVPVRVMVRDISESFVYSEEIMNSHINYIKSLKDLNVAGIIFGSLNNEGKINFQDLEKGQSLAGCHICSV